jgi:hypothetical protein
MEIESINAERDRKNIEVLGHQPPKPAAATSEAVSLPTNIHLSLI